MARSDGDQRAGNDVIREAVKLLAQMDADEAETLLDSLDQIDDLWWTDEGGVLCIAVRLDRG